MTAFQYPAEKIITLREFIRDFEEIDRRPGAAPFCFILGSGASFNAGIPTGEQLVNRWLLELFNTEGPEADCIPIPVAQADTYGSALLPHEEQCVRAWAENNLSGRPGFENFSWERRANYYGALYARRYRSNPSLGPVFLRERIVGKRPTAGYFLLARILARSRHRVVVTTNFDRLIEDAVAQSEGSTALSLGHDQVARYLDRDFGLPIVAKVHGDIFLETYNATDDIAELRTEWKATLSRVFRVHTPIIVGYGGNDPGFMSFLATSGAELFGNRAFYWCFREKSGPPRNPLVHQLAGLRGFRLVPISGFDELVARLNQRLKYPSLVDDLETAHASLRAQIKRAMEQMDGHKPEGVSLFEEPDLTAQTGSMLRSSVPASTQCIDPFTHRAVPLTTANAGTAVPNNWREWKFKISCEPVPAASQELLTVGLLALPGSVALQSLRALKAATANPHDLSIEAEGRAALEDGILHLGPEHEETLEAASNLAVILMLHGKSDEAEALQRQTLEVRERVLGREHPDTLQSINRLAILQKNAGNLGHAESMYRRALEAQERILGPENPNTLSTQINLATLLRGKGDLVTAESLFRRAVEGLERVLGPAHPDTLTAQHNLANLLYEKGDPTTAESLHRHILAARERILRPEHPDILRSQYNLANSLCAQANWTAAESQYRQVLALQERVLGHEHPDTALTISRLSFVLEQKGDLVTAEPMADRAWRAFLFKMGAEHQLTIMAEGFLALVRRRLASVDHQS